MAWSLEFLPVAESDIAVFNKPTRRRVIDKLEWLRENFDSVTPIPLTGEFRDFYKLRIGDLRIFYSINWRRGVIIVCYIGRRDKAYKSRK